MSHPRPDSDELRQRSMATTREIAAVVREIRELLAVPSAGRDEDWQARQTALVARKAALLAECEDIAATRERCQHHPQPPPPHDSPGPAAAREVRR